MAALVTQCLTQNITPPCYTSTGLDDMGCIQYTLAGKLALTRFDTVGTIDKISCIEPGLKASEVVSTSMGLDDRLPPVAGGQTKFKPHTAPSTT